MQVDYRTEHKQAVEVRGIPCEFFDMRILPETVPEGKFQYEVAGDDDSGGDPARIRPGILVNFYGTLICDQPLQPDEGDTIWLQDNDWRWIV